MRQLQLRERKILEKLWNAGESISAIAAALGRSDYCVRSEIARNSPDGLTYDAEKAQQMEITRRMKRRVGCPGGG